ncbi:sulfatase family protein [Reichenbachiella ulvae]|uniref:Sulfatase n=1 Tax=Reichenbachiella ulvae TaxID=2980104 RepID=A0ABT3D030_9BACT|nr:sulfatase [Reichenbachiella ulvae]MCV9389305.1 sulfatase [Reichenbachiella ulvae]
MKKISVLLLAAASLLWNNCSSVSSMQTETQPDRPNVLWIYVEDLNPFFSSYGVDINPTPVIDGLAENGVLFKKAFTPAPVCSSARSAIITGTMPTTFGTHNHHSSRTMEDAIFLPEGVKTIPEIFKKAGYYTFNHGKDDYNFVYNRKELYNDPIKVDYWYTFAGKGNYLDSLTSDKPFFGQVQLNGGKLSLVQAYDNNLKKMGIEPIDRNLVELPPYYPNLPSVHEDWARHYDAARMTDIEVSGIMEELKAKGLLNNTYVFFFTDHGYKGIRHKQFVYDGGIHIPLIVAYYGEGGKIKKGEIREDLVNGIDIGTTSLKLAGLDIPAYMEGMDMFASDFNREYIVAARDRCDFSIDRIRAIRTDQFKYIKNYMPHRSYTQPAYRDRRAEYVDIKKAYEAGELNEVQAKYWKPTKPVEELFDLENDPHEINNLAEDPAYAKVLQEHRDILTEWTNTYGDKGAEPQNIFSLKHMISRWGDRCINEEFENARNYRISNTPRVSLK